MPQSRSEGLKKKPCDVSGASLSPHCFCRLMFKFLLYAYLPLTMRNKFCLSLSLITKITNLALFQFPPTFQIQF